MNRPLTNTLGNLALPRQADACEIEVLSDPATDLVLKVTSYERVLKRTLLFAVGEVRCQPTHPLFKEGSSPQSCPYIDFMRSSVVRATDGHPPAVLNANCANFQNVGSTYQRRLLDERGDFNDWIAVSPSFLAELSAERASSSRAADGIFFEKPLAPITPLQYMAQRHLHDTLIANGNLHELAFDEYLACLVQSIVNDADSYWQRETKPKMSPRPMCDRRRRDIVEAVKERLAKEYWINHSLADLARSAHCSISKLVRIFRIETGSSLHSYQQHIRIRHSLQLLKESSCDLNDIATQLGFANHSHFTTVFRRQFGIAPSEYRIKGSPFLVSRSFAAMRSHMHPRSLANFAQLRRAGRAATMTSSADVSFA
jgi:AraC-like DNA-binding protein